MRHGVGGGETAHLHICSEAGCRGVTFVTRPLQQSEQVACSVHKRTTQVGVFNLGRENIVGVFVHKGFNLLYFHLLAGGFAYCVVNLPCLACCRGRLLCKGGPYGFTVYTELCHVIKFIGSYNTTHVITLPLVVDDHSMVCANEWLPRADGSAVC